MTDGFKRLGREGPTTVRDQGRGGAIAQTRRVADHERHPTGFHGGHGAREHGARVAVQHDQAPPLDTLQGNVHFPTVNTPKLMGGGGFIRVRCRVLFGGLTASMRDIIIELPVEGHDPFDRADGDICPCQQAPDPEPAGIGMTLLEVIHFEHQRQPDLTSWVLGGGALVCQARNVFGLEARNPPIHRRTRDVQDATDTEFIPALLGQLHDLDSGLIAVFLAVIVTQREFPWHRG
jgi:hypothetical protein